MPVHVSNVAEFCHPGIGVLLMFKKFECIYKLRFLIRRWSKSNRFEFVFNILGKINAYDRTSVMDNPKIELKRRKSPSTSIVDRSSTINSHPTIYKTRANTYTRLNISSISIVPRCCGRRLYTRPYTPSTRFLRCPQPPFLSLSVVQQVWRLVAAGR